MGDKNAVDWAQEAHVTLLGAEGSYLPGSRILNGRPFPRGDMAELVVIDDHVAISLRAKGRRHAARPQQSFELAQTAYESAGLVPHPGKARRDDSEG
eukprot:4059312-Heterocapsa_arctica.AAC.1